MEKEPGHEAQKPSDTISKRTLLALAAPLAVLLIAGAVFVYWANNPKYDLKGEPTNQPQAVDETPTPATSAPDISPQAADEATGTATNAPAPIFGSNDYRRGASAKLFLNDEVQIWENDQPVFRVKATQFTDSRCPPGAQCVWAGERGLEVEVALERSEAAPQKTVLSETTRQTAQAFGLNLSLVKIDDAKGGTYAEIKFE
jgi:hypothetical protein